MSELSTGPSDGPQLPTRASILGIRTTKVNDFEHGKVRKDNGGHVGFHIDLSETVLAAEPYITFDHSIAEFAGKLAVDAVASSALLRQYGQSEDRSRSLRIAFVDAKRIAGEANMPQGVVIGAWHEPLGKRYRWTGVNPWGLDVYHNYIGMPINGPEDLTPEGIKRLNDFYRHELGHCATQTVPFKPSLYERDENDNLMPYWYKTVYGVLPVALAVGYLRLRRVGEFEALWRLDKNERVARQFEADHPDFSPITPLEQAS